MSEPLDGAAEAVSEDTTAADQVAEETQAQGDEQPGDDAAAAQDDEAEGDKPAKPRRSVQERIDDAIRKQRDAERDAEYWRAKALQDAQTEAARTQPEDSGEPNPADYEHGELDARFIREHATYAATKAFREEQARAEAARQQRDRLSAFDQAAKAVAEKHPDFHEVVGRDYERAAAVCTDPMREAILSSEDGPAVAYHLASNPDEARRIAALDPVSQIRALGRLEASLANPPAPPRNPATNAPPATPQVRGAGGRFASGPRDEQPLEDWLAARNAQLGR